jgi:DedD protein
MTTDIERGGIDVSGSHEPSYYEIALTNRQVVVAFVILLVCVVAAFLSGVWIGRESTARAQEKLAQLARAAAADSADKDKTEGQALQEFKFFADPHHRPGPTPAGAATPPAPDGAARPARRPAGTDGGAATDTASAAADDGARGPQAPPAPRTPMPATLATSTTAAARKDARAARTAAAQAAANPANPPNPLSTGPGGEGEAAPPAAADNVVRPRPLPDAPAPPVSAAKRGAAAADTGGSPSSHAADAGAGAAGEVVIQVFSSADREQADRVRGGLVDAGFQAFLSPIAKNGQTMYRVRIGPFATRADAEPVAEKVRKEQKLDTWITPK